jgi:hypothetical protein
MQFISNCVVCGLWCASCSVWCSVVAVASYMFVCRPGDYKPMPPPKTGAPYKPVPPPKPKNYRPPLAPEGGGGGGGGSWSFGGGLPSQPCGDADSTVAAMLKHQATGLPTYQHAKSYSVAGGLDAAGYMPQHNGGKCAVHSTQAATYPRLYSHIYSLPY